ncbi:MAG: FAD-dependent oxidoreductase [Gammaproteobacteria bacterium]|nr:FAD-dependent oxidoreductase [Gammaproteobacteria bacterium]
MPVRIALLSAVGLAIVAFLVFGGPQALSLSSLQAHFADWHAWRTASPFEAAGLFFAAYVALTALSLPGALVLTLAAGALFGLLWGTVLASFASSLGALLAFLMSRFVFRNWLSQRFAQRLAAIDTGIRREGAWYLFALRLVPVFPYVLINLLMGLTAMPARTFYWVSQVAMLAGTLVYVNAGTQLAHIEGLSGIVSPALLGSLALLGVFPFVAKRALAWQQRRRVYARWPRPQRFDRNLVVIGAGAAGLVSAFIAAAVKAQVTLIEAHEMGGDCLNYGCVPSKALIAAGRQAQRMRTADRVGLTPVDPSFSFRAVVARVHEAIRTIAPHDSVERYTALGVDVRRGHARLIDPWTVEISTPGGRREALTARAIVLATGARPIVPPLPGLDEVGYLTSDTLWARLAELDAPPRRLLVLGGGPLGCELAQAFARLGSEVTQVEMAERLMIREDPEVSTFVRERLERDGVRVLTAHQALRAGRADDKKELVVMGAEGELALPFDEMLVAVGRQARLEGYGLEALGIDFTRTIATNDYLETRYPHIYAAGDVVGPYQFTHAAGHQAWYAAVNALFGGLRKFKVDYAAMPWVTFVDPEVARVGLNEQDARTGGVAYEVTRYALDDLDRAIAEGETEGFIKVLTVPGKDRILGVTLVGAHAGELLGEFVLAMKHGLGLNKILNTVHAYPTWVEANKATAGAWRRAHAPAGVLRWVARYHAWLRGRA